MTATDMANGAYKVDDTFDDAEAAYKEVMGRTEEKPAPAPVHEPEVIESLAKTDKLDKPAEPEAKPRDDGRDEHGRFKAKDSDGQASPGQQKAGVEAKTPGADEAPATLSPDKAPPSFSVQSKAAWAALPAEVRADIVKREGEMANGLQALTQFKDLKPWADLAASKGTTLTAALKSYTGIETLLKRDPEAGLARIAENLGKTKAEAAAMFAQLAAKLGHGQAPADDDPVRQAVDPYLKPLLDKIAALEGAEQSRVQAAEQQRNASLDTALKTLEADAAYPFVNDLFEDMTFLLENGRVQRTGDALQDLKTAYDTAAYLNPQTRQALIEQRQTEARETQRRAEQEAANKAKAASRSVTASHMPGTVHARGNDNGGADDMEADVMNAYRQVYSR